MCGRIPHACTGESFNRGANISHGSCSYIQQGYEHPIALFVDLQLRNYFAV